MTCQVVQRYHHLNKSCKNIFKKRASTLFSFIEVVRDMSCLSKAIKKLLTIIHCNSLLYALFIWSTEFAELFVVGGSD